MNIFYFMTDVKETRESKASAENLLLANLGISGLKQ